MADSVLPVGDILYFGVLITLGYIATTSTSAVPATVVGIPEKTEDQEKSEEKDIVIPAPPPRQGGTTYYHSTTWENATAIGLSGLMLGSPWEGGYVYAFKNRPSQYAVENSGAHLGVVISFKTNASFTGDIGIDDPAVLAYGPVVSTTPGPIVVWDVEIVGVSK